VGSPLKNCSMSQSSASFDPLTNPNEDASQDVRDEYVDWPNRCEFLSEVGTFEDALTVLYV